MKFLSLCSGIDAASVASAPLGWQCVGFSEIEPFPCAVLDHRYPSVTNFGDMTKYAEWPEQLFIDADAIVGGPPCQAFSMAGKREGLDDARGNLTLIYANLIDHADRIRRVHGKSPVWCLYENVPGLLSDRTNAFGCLLGKLAGEDVPLLPTGGKWTNAGFVSGPSRSIAWRTLDAQYFGVAQRRRRVFVVAGSGDFDPAKVLFESEGVRRDSAPSREAGKGIAPVAGTLSANGGGTTRPAGNCNELDFCVALQDCTGREKSQNGLGISEEGVSYTIDTTGQQGVAHPTTRFKLRCGCEGGGKGYLGQEDAAFTLATGIDQHLFHNSAVDGIGLVNTIQSQGINQSTHADAEKAGSVEILRALQETIGEEAFYKWCAGIVAALFPSEILRIFVHGIGVRQPTIDEFGLVNYALSRPENRGERALLALREAGCSGRTPQGWESLEQFAGKLGAYLSELSHPTASAKGFLQDLWQAAEGFGVLRQTLSTLQEAREPSDGEGQPAYGSAVRRLTPVEAEFLQGFPRNYTSIPWKKRPAEECPDGQRYKALGNSWAVPCARWIFERVPTKDN